MNRTYQLHELPLVIADFWLQFSHNSVFAFTGEMGAGKTTFIRALCAKLGVLDPVVSPTYSLINEYATSSGGAIYHADLYRLSSADEALEAGMGEWPQGDALYLIEWPERFSSYLPENTVWVHIRTIDPMTRSLHVNIPQ